jgi:hypothetical protein
VFDGDGVSITAERLMAPTKRFRAGRGAFLCLSPRDSNRMSRRRTQMKDSLIVFLGSGVGGVARHLFNQLVTSVAGSGFPWGILAINITGSTALGLVAGLFAFRGANRFCVYF